MSNFNDSDKFNVGSQENKRESPKSSDQFNYHRSTPRSPPKNEYNHNSK